MMPRPRRYSIAWRLAINLSVGLFVLWLLAAIVGSAVMHRELREAFDETLRQGALRLLPLIVHEMKEDSDDRRLREVPDLERGESNLTYFILNSRGRTIISPTGAPAKLDLSGIPDGFSDIGQRRAYALTDSRSQFRIVVIEQSDDREEAVHKGMVALVMPLAALLPITALGVWAFVRHAMRPLDRLRREVTARDSRNLAPLDTKGHPVELAPIAEAVAALLDRLRAALDAERAFAASSAHELRTPIAGALAQTQRLAIELGKAPGAERVRHVESSLRHLSALSEKLLQLSRLDAGFASSNAPQDLSSTLRLVVNDFAARAAEPVPIDLVIDSDAVLVVPLNVDAFAIALTNLIHNARIHGAPNAPISVVAGPGPVVRVINGGPVVSSETLERLGQRFVRGDTRAKGSGLGLAIVQAIMVQMGGELKLLSPASARDDGFEAVLCFNTAGHDANADDASDDRRCGGSAAGVG